MTGLLLKACDFLGQPSGDRYFEDSPFWHIPHDHESSDMSPIVSKVIYELEKRQSSPNKLDASGVPLLAADLTIEETSFTNDHKA